MGSSEAGWAIRAIEDRHGAIAVGDRYERTGGEAKGLVQEIDRITLGDWYGEPRFFIKGKLDTFLEADDIRKKYSWKEGRSDVS